MPFLLGLLHLSARVPWQFMSPLRLLLTPLGWIKVSSLEFRPTEVINKVFNSTQPGQTKQCWSGLTRVNLGNNPIKSLKFHILAHFGYVHLIIYLSYLNILWFRTIFMIIWRRKMEKIISKILVSVVISWFYHKLLEMPY